MGIPPEIRPNEHDGPPGSHVDSTPAKSRSEDCGIPFKERHYPYFSLGFMAPWQLEFLTMPYFMELAEVDGRRLIVGEPLLQEYRLLDVGHTDQFSHLVRMDHSAGLNDDGLHLMEMLQVRRGGPVHRD